jgi:8-oxo-dGTP pyrophosphatase MutT (NUDIX family)
MFLSLPAVRQRLAEHRPRLSSPEDSRLRAAVAMLLRPAGEQAELLFIRRAVWEGDRWSGDIAFPGGRISAADPSPRHAAERETLEEVGVDLTAATYLGQLDDLTGRAEAVVVSAFVYVVHPEVPIRLNAEVDDTCWLPLREIARPERQITRRFQFHEHEVDLPALLVFGGDAPVLWGLTYRFLERFMHLLGGPIPAMPWDPMR